MFNCKFNHLLKFHKKHPESENPNMYLKLSEVKLITSKQVATTALLSSFFMRMKIVLNQNP